MSKYLDSVNRKLELIDRMIQRGRIDFKKIKDYAYEMVQDIHTAKISGEELAVLLEMKEIIKSQLLLSIDEKDSMKTLEITHKLIRIGLVNQD